MSVRHESLRRGSVVQSISKEVPWDIFDRLFLPLVYCHAIAIIFSAIIQFFEIRFAFSTFGIFTIFSLATVAFTLFFHNLKVSSNFSNCFVVTQKKKIYKVKFIRKIFPPYGKSTNEFQICWFMTQNNIVYVSFETVSKLNCLNSFESCCKCRWLDKKFHKIDGKFVRKNEFPQKQLKNRTTSNMSKAKSVFENNDIDFCINNKVIKFRCCFIFDLFVSLRLPFFYVPKLKKRCFSFVWHLHTYFIYTS